jgi:hypothetical protein
MQSQAQVVVPSLNGCLAKLGRASEHIGIVGASTQRAKPPLVAAVEVEFATGRTERTVTAALKVVSIPEIPDHLSLAIGEALYNIRSALDYLASELIALNEGVYWPMSQFPIATSPAKHGDLAREAIGRLGGYWEIIEQYQPYGDPADVWSSAFRILRDTSNIDKHRRPVTPVVTVDVSAHSPMTPGVGVARTAPPRIHAGVMSPGRTIVSEELLLLDDDPQPIVHCLGTYFPAVSFEDWPTLTVTDVLHVIHRKAELLIHRFLPLFR